MKVLELRAILSRLDPNADVLVTSAPTDGHGSFACGAVGHSLERVSQDRTVRDGGVTYPVLVLHFKADARYWAAKAHSPNPAPVRVKAIVKNRGQNDELVLCKVRSVGDVTEENAASLWNSIMIDTRPLDAVGSTYEPIVFTSELDARKAVIALDHLMLERFERAD